MHIDSPEVEEVGVPCVKLIETLLVGVRSLFYLAEVGLQLVAYHLQLFELVLLELELHLQVPFFGLQKLRPGDIPLILPPEVRNPSLSLCD